LALLVGQLIISLDWLAPVTFPIFHVLGVSLPTIAILLLFARGLKIDTPGPTQRQMVAQVALGALGMTLVSFTLEVLVAAIALVALGVVMALTPGGLAQLAELQTVLADPAWLGDPAALAHWLLKPGIIILIAVVLVVIVPIIEEGAKSLGVPLLALGGRVKPALAQGWLWGIAVGAGFAIAEGLFNSAASLPFWAVVVLLRAGASAMHMVTAGLTGLGWTRWLTSRNYLALLASYLGSLTLHGLWNGLTVLIVIASLWTMAEPGDTTPMAAGGVGVAVGVLGLILLTVAAIGVAAYITRRVGEPHR
jgi:RsiW-degrading membrane proteinase PrsW (M82 family)